MKEVKNKQLRGKRLQKINIHHKQMANANDTKDIKHVRHFMNGFRESQKS